MDMFFDDVDIQYKLVAPDVDNLCRFFDSGWMNPTKSTPELLAAFDKVYSILTPLAPLKKNSEAKAIWLRIPRGTIEDYGNSHYTFEEAKEADEVKTYEEYVDYWNQEYPEDMCWYELVAVKSFERNGSLRYYGMSLGEVNVMSALIEERGFLNEKYYYEDAAVRLCELILPAVQKSVDLLTAGVYNDVVESELPYQFRTGVIKRKDIWAKEPDRKEWDYDGLSEEADEQFKKLVREGHNDLSHIGRIERFTANDFFRACKIGYEAIGKDCEGFSLPDLYMHYSDGRDEGLTGKGFGLNEGPGVDFDSPEAWDDWYYGSRGGGHPWEVVPGGNSTHMSLCVCNDKNDLDWKLRSGQLSQDEYDRKIKDAGYYFEISGIRRQFESVSFYIALSSAGIPVILDDAEELMARFDASDYIGVVPHSYFTRYCEHLFPDKYGRIIDFVHVYKGEDEWFDDIEWIPEEPAELI